MNGSEVKALKEELKKRISQLTILYQVGRDMSEHENWSDALDRFLMALVKYMQAEGATLLLFSQNCRALRPRASFQVKEDELGRCCSILVDGWFKHPRSSEIHCLEGYTEKRLGACLERLHPWRLTVVPLKHSNRALGFLLLDKAYKNGKDFESDFQFMHAIQSIFVEQVASATYVSELRSLSKFNQKVLENINSGVITTDSSGNVDFFNRRAKAIFPQLCESRKIHFDETFKSESFGPVFFKRIVESGKDNYTIEVTGINQKGESFPVRLSTSRMIDESLGKEALVAIFDDLTEQKLLEKEIRRNDRLRTLGQLSAGVAHEIRNPLTGIATSVEVLKSKLQGDDEKIKYIKAVLDEINRLDGIIKNLLDFARPARPRLRKCSLGEVVLRVYKLMTDSAKKKGIEIEVIDELNCADCIADPDQLAQVLINLVLNAVQACSSGNKVKILIGQCEDKNEGSVARIEVEDTGPGVNEAIRESLFEPFVTTKSRGTGMGLAISRQIIEEHNGHLACEFLVKGTKFVITLPMKLPESMEKRKNRSTEHV